MFETSITIVGTIVTDPVHRIVGEQELFKFRVASNSRRRMSDGSWEQGDSLFVTVNCWGRIVAGAAASLVKGDPVIVVGHVHTNEYTDKDEIRRSSTEVRATAVGPDLSRAIARIDRTKQQPERSSVEDADDQTEDDDAAEDATTVLPLTA